jgi:hypothetical protein
VDTRNECKSSNQAARASFHLVSRYVIREVRTEIDGHACRARNSYPTAAVQVAHVRASKNRTARARARSIQVSQTFSCADELDKTQLHLGTYVIDRLRPPPKTSRLDIGDGIDPPPAMAWIDLGVVHAPPQDRRPLLACWVRTRHRAPPADCASSSSSSSAVQ